MERKERYTLTKNERLKSRKTIELLFKSGKSFSIYPFRIVYQFASLQPLEKGTELQAGFTVSTKYFKKAVDRNRVRRLMKEAYRLQKNQLQEMLSINESSLSVFFIYTAKELPAYQFVFEKTLLALERLIKLTGETKR
ncbi:MAG: ribonuclease P protein component [Ferruginibacter sp.]